MNGKQIDYDKIAKEYAINRSINPEVFKELYLNSRINENSTILEVGCGTGNYIGALKSITDCSCYGLELSKEMLKEAKRVSKRVNFKKGRVERIDFPESFF
ncbi:class I SAM-dependent methyltransferase, partial [candidate division WOR-3 bacterium]|nr:class I SAM-dependent methyltransferase [candidate division WOR-3 bacterium]